MIKTEADFFGSTVVTKPVGAKLNCKQISAHFIGAITTIVRIALPELALIILSPTLDATIYE